MHRIAFFGPEGTFTEQAARSLSGGEAAAELVPYETIAGAMAAVRGGETSAACVPVENSVEGPVTATLDELAEDEPLVAVAEALLPIHFTVLARHDLAAADVRTVASHPHALAQVRGWLSANLPAARQVATASTAAAALAVQSGEYDAAVAAPVAAEHYDLAAIATDVADVEDARTRFLLLQRPGRLPEPTGCDRTSVVAAAANRTGALSELLTELAFRGINLTRLDARPIKGGFGEYRFFIDFEGHVAEPRIGDALAALRRRCAVRFLGSHPRADGVPASIQPAAGNEDFVNATDWVESVRRGDTA
ncbi:prephenate dehydratase [Haloechinothrix sp. LS1_15]|uniref:prephenate dehydratase n=1 Tax=Haloechinothrix sp. LS1_15 TaxID=2652248 RepID=UPI00294437AE|nr:prephenate dehydratase [Haloechinothrix sp. LS1_15]MDV6012349.1 prephenate dehydratase [Haloechinothrix sp. LS1_15]